MKFVAAGTLALLMVVFAGCSRPAASTVAASNTSFTSSQPVGTGLKAVNQVSPCCRPLAEGRISLDQCMENPVCKANNRQCCMNAIQ